MQRLLAGLAVSCLTLALPACNDQHEVFRPFDVDAVSVSTDAKQRVILSAVRGTEGKRRRVVCAEPSPDAVSALAASTGGSLGVALPAGATPEQIQANLALTRAVAEQVAYVGVRNATIQLLRDGLYRACEAYMNGAVGDFGYALILTNYGKTMAALLTIDGVTRPGFTGATVLTGTASGNGGGGGGAG
ncbi:MAG: hypothetical protein KDG89_17385, partial [Geminicoccaceae bacterium]|nr:hypothetical protein [Geminicoccaceae bacterium]